jgi:hypothetical protein
MSFLTFRGYSTHTHGSTFLLRYYGNPVYPSGNGFTDLTNRVKTSLTLLGN